MKLFMGIKEKLNSVLHLFLSLSLIKKGVIVIVILIVGGIIGTRIFTKNNAAPQYQTATAEKGTLITNVTVSGTVSSANSAPITTQATGVVNAVYVKNGDYVNQGDKIAEVSLDQQSQQKQAAANASYLSAVSNLNSAQAKMNSLKANLFQANQTFLQDRGIDNPSDDQKADPQYIIQESNWLQAEADYKNQATAISQASANLASATLSYQQASSTIIAPISGTISNLKITSGTPILETASSVSSGTNSNSVQTVGNVSLPDAHPQATVNLTEIDVVSVKVDQKATLTLDAFPNKTFTGRVSSIDTNGLVSSGVTTYPTTITFDTAPEGIYPNMAVSAQIITSVTDEVLLIPTTAIQTQNDASYVRVLKNGQVQQVDVTLGKSSDTETQITEGLQEGETIITGETTPANTTTGATSPFGGTGIGGGRTNTGFGSSGGVRISR